MSSEDKKNQASVDKKTAGRRKLLKSVVAGSGAATVAKMMPDEWARPVVDSVMLPSHARTSMRGIGPFVNSGPIGLIGREVMMAEQGFSEELLEFFTPAAHAGYEEPEMIAMTANESGNSYICAYASNVTTEKAIVQIQNTDPLSFTGANGCVFGGQVLGGTFVEGTGWQVEILPPEENISTVVTLVEGGTGCSSGEITGKCPLYND